MHMDPISPSLTGLAVIVLGMAIIMGRARLPLINAYIIAGVVIGPEVLNLVSDGETIRRLGEVGLILLLFFLGMELSLPRLATNWRVSVLGTIGQILATVLAFGAPARVYRGRAPDEGIASRSHPRDIHPIL